MLVQIIAEKITIPVSLKKTLQSGFIKIVEFVNYDLL